MYKGENITIWSQKTKQPRRNQKGDMVAYGKIFPWKGKLILRVIVYNSYKRIDDDSWGVREPLLDYAQEMGVTHVVIYNKDEDWTKHVKLETVRMYGTDGKTDEFGKTINLREMYWSEAHTGRQPDQWVTSFVVRPPAKVAVPA